MFSQSLNARGLPLLRQDTRNTWTRLLHHTFAYDANANVSSILDGAGSQADYTDDSRWLGYDGLDRLTVANSRDQNACMQWGYGWGEASFEYHALDNLRRFRMGPLDMRYHHDSQQRLQGITFGGVGFRSYAHNARGQMTQREHADRQYSLSWDSAHRLLSTQAPGHSESYRYDAHGHRVRTQRSGETVWSVYSRAGTLLFEQTSLGQNRRHIHLGARQVAETRNGQRRYLHTDHLGTPRVQTDAFGTVVQRDVRAPYGSVLAGFDYRQGAGFTGHMEDGATALTYMKARYYDPVAMRFLSPDPVYVDLGTGGNFNRYWYANNNPYKFVDPDGREGKVAWLVKLTADQMHKVARLSKEQAIRARRAQENVVGDIRQVASQIETAAMRGREGQMRHAGHELADGSRGLPHYQTEGKRGHSFWGKLGVAATVAAGALENAAEAATWIPDPVPRPATSDDVQRWNSTIGAVQEATGLPLSGLRVSENNGFQGVFRVEGRFDSKRLTRGRDGGGGR